MARVLESGANRNKYSADTDEALLDKYNNRTYGKSIFVFPEVSTAPVDPYVPPSDGTGTGNVVIIPSSNNDGNVYLLNGNSNNTVDGR